METVKDASVIIGEIHIRLKRIGIVPTATLTHRIDDGVPVFIVTLAYQEGFARRRYKIVREAIEAPEYAFQYALEDFWNMVIEDMRTENVDEKK